MVARQTVVALILVALLLLAGCPKPGEPPPPPSINGNYVGTYRFIQIESGVDTMIDSTQGIHFLLRNGNYVLSIGDLPDSLSARCEKKGTYELGDGVTMSVPIGDFTPIFCPRSYGFGGLFSLEQTSDTMRLLNDQTDSLGVREIRDLRLVLD
jgi:hypothetical protein